MAPNAVVCKLLIASVDGVTVYSSLQTALEAKPQMLPTTDADKYQDQDAVGHGFSAQKVIYT